MTNPCSVPNWLRLLIPLETEWQQNACRRHDQRYALGGVRHDRLLADTYFLQELVEARMDPDLAEMYFWGVRMYGGEHWPGGDAPGVTPPKPPETTEAP